MFDSIEHDTESEKQTPKGSPDLNLAD